MYLIFDVSANGKPKSWKAPAEDVFNWPRLTHLAWLHYNADRELIAKGNDLIQPNNWTIKAEFEKKYDLTQEKAEAEGIPAREALQRFAEEIPKAQHLIVHNLNFAENVLTAEFKRHAMAHKLGTADKYCLMQEATWFCKLPGRGGKYKWPQLQELHAIIFGQRYANAGNAFSDVSAATMCFFRLLDLEAIEVF